MKRFTQARCRSFLTSLFLLVAALAFGHQAAQAQSTQPVLAEYLAKVAPADMAESADAYGALRADVAVAPLLSAGKEIGYVFVTSDFVGTTGYSGKPIHTMVAVDMEARILGVQLVKHSEPIV
ncbi:regulatory protein NosR, partial [Escherichia coli]|nr:regulatory protein NosR [Escherichia coli]